MYVDANHSGQFELGEPNTITNANGDYTLTLSLSQSQIVTLGVKPLAGWIATSPDDSGFRNPFVDLSLSAGGTSATVANQDFGFKPPASPSGVGNATIFGLVFNDLNNDHIQQSASEKGVKNITVFLDGSNGKPVNGLRDTGETFTLTDSNGAYHFDDVATGSATVRVEVSEPFTVTAPMSGVFALTLAAGQVASGVVFGVHNAATDDYGDLTATGFQTFGANAPHNPTFPRFTLGTNVDAEIRPASFDASGNPIPALNGIGDDQTGPIDPGTGTVIDDEDGVTVVGGAIRPGSNTIAVVVQGIGGYLNGWIDLNNSGTFDSGEQIITNVRLNTGTSYYTFTAPQSIGDGTIAARFRWGDQGQNWFGANPNPGEVEDYLFDSKAATLRPGDYNGDQAVDVADYNLWKSSFGSTTDLRADGNHNGSVDAGDYTVWADHRTAPGSGSAALSMAAEDTGQTPANVVATSIVSQPVGSSLGASAVDTALATASAPLSTIVETQNKPIVFSGAASLSESASDKNLLLLDRAMADFGGRGENSSAFDVGTIVADSTPDGSQQQLQLSDLALAAAFDSDSDWRNGV